MPTIKDVAREAGVAVSTVSYALSGVRPVAEETRQRILRAVEALNYHPNILARGLVSKRTRIVALLYPAVSLSSLDDLPIEFIASVTNATHQHDYGLLLFTHPLGEPEMLRFINQGLVDGVILMEVQRYDPRVKLMQDAHYPFSLIGHGENNDGISFVDMDFYASYGQTVAYLVALDHDRIGFLPGITDLENLPYNYLFQSVRGFQDGLAKTGAQGVVIGCEPTVQGAYEAVKRLLETQPGITALVVVNELIYQGVSLALHEAGLRVPHDVSVIAAVSSRSAEKYTPKLTTLSIPATQMGHLATEFLIQHLEDSHFKPQQVILSAEFIVRESTAARKIQAE